MAAGALWWWAAGGKAPLCSLFSSKMSAVKRAYGSATGPVHMQTGRAAQAADLNVLMLGSSSATHVLLLLDNPGLEALVALPQVSHAALLVSNLHAAASGQLRTCAMFHLGAERAQPASAAGRSAQEVGLTFLVYTSLCSFRFWMSADAFASVGCTLNLFSRRSSSLRAALSWRSFSIAALQRSVLQGQCCSSCLVQVLSWSHHLCF